MIGTVEQTDTIYWLQIQLTFYLKMYTTQTMYHAARRLHLCLLAVGAHSIPIPASHYSNHVPISSSPRHVAE